MGGPGRGGRRAGRRAGRPRRRLTPAGRCAIDELLHALAELPPALICLFIGAGAAVENLVPPIPADTFVLFGAFLAAMGRGDALLVFFCTWVPNVGTAFVVYGLARRYGRAFFGTPAGRWLLHPRQLERLERFYHERGTSAIFASRFLPALRALVPVFAGVSRMAPRRLLLPLAGASALWYGALIALGSLAGRNWDAILAAFERVNRVLLVLGLALLALVLAWWWRTRRRPR